MDSSVLEDIRKLKEKCLRELLNDDTYCIPTEDQLTLDDIHLLLDEIEATESFIRASPENPYGK